MPESPEPAPDPAPVPASSQPPESRPEALEHALELKPAKAAFPILAWVFFGLQAAIFLYAANKSGYWMNLIYDESSPIGPLVQFHGGVAAYQIATNPARVLTSMFVDALGIQAVINLMILWGLGPELEKVLGKVRFAFLYLVGGMGAMLLCDLLGRFFPAFGVGQSYGLGARHAVFVALGSLTGVMAAFQGLRKAATSRFLWSRVLSIGGLVLIAYLLRYHGNLGFGIDIARFLTDLFVGVFLGWFLGLSMLDGTRRTAGFALSAVFLLGVVGELGYFSSQRGEEAPPKKTGGERNGIPSPNRGRTVPDTTTEPRGSMPDEVDPPEIAKIRERAQRFLEPLGPLPEPSPAADVKKEAGDLADELDGFDQHWTKTASANLEVEEAELRMIAGEVSKASDVAHKCIDLIAPRNPPPRSVFAKRLARAYGVAAMCELEKSSGRDEIAARSYLERAWKFDALPEVHFFLGQLASETSKKKEELELFLKLVDMKPPAQDTLRADRALEAKKLLGR